MSILALDRVFVANMTGNAVFLAGAYAAELVLVAAVLASSPPGRWPRAGAPAPWRADPATRAAAPR